MSEAFPLAVAQSWRRGSQGSLDTLNLFRLQPTKSSLLVKQFAKFQRKPIYEEKLNTTYSNS